MGYIIEKNIPIERPKKRKKSPYPFSEMEIGDSFFIEAKQKERKIKANTNVRIAHMRFCKSKNIKQKCTVLEVINGIRFWRTK